MERETDAAPEGRSRRWLVVPLVALALAAGVVLGPSVPLGQGAPADGSVEVGFAQDMQVHHQQAITMSLQAALRTRDDEVRALAVDLVATQSSQVGRMGGWLEEWDAPRTSAYPQMAWMRAAHEGQSGHALLADGRMPGMASTAELEALSRASGVELDRQYLALLITHHRGGLAMAADAEARTDDEDVQALASAVVRGQTAELEVLVELLERLGGTVPPEGSAGA